MAIRHLLGACERGRRCVREEKWNGGKLLWFSFLGSIEYKSMYILNWKWSSFPSPPPVYGLFSVLSDANANRYRTY